MTMPPSWPTQTDFQDALQHPEQCFGDEALQQATPADLTPFGLPAPITGQFANVYRLRLPDENGFRAVRLFIHASPDRPQRYAAIEAHLKQLQPSLPAFATMAYQPQGIFVRGSWYPLVKMDWVTGTPLNTFVEAHLYESQRLWTLARTFRTLTQNLREARIAHGDLQHGNILVEESPEGDRLRLVDYDGLWVPALAGRDGIETGHPSYQHPRRTVRDFNPFLDRFSAFVIYAALLAIAEAPQVWYQLNNSENLLFRREDFVAPVRSRGFTLLRDALYGSYEARQILDWLRDAAAGPLSAVPDLPR